MTGKEEPVRNDKDRVWWLWIPIALLCLAGILVLNAYILPLTIDLDSVANHIMALFLEVMLGIVALVMAPTQASQARKRARARAAAVRGDAEAIPRAAIPTDAAQAPDVAAEPLVLMWRPTRAARVIYGIAGLLLGPLSLAVVVMIVVFWLDDSPSELLLAAFGTARFAAVAVPAVMLLLFGIISISLCVLAWVWVRGRPFGIIASAAGIRMRSMSGRVRFVLWQDIRLFEVLRERNAPRNRLTYQLYASRHTIKWTHPLQGGGMFKPDGATSDEMRARAQELLDLIAARTSLVPRTFDKALQPGDRATTMLPLHRPSAPASFTGWLALIVFWSFIGGIIRYLPLTTSLAWNMLFAVVPLLAILAAAIRNLASSHPDLQAPEVVARLHSAQPPIAAPDTVFALAYARSRRKRFAGALRASPFALEGMLLLLLLASGVVPLVGVALGLPRLPGTGAIVLAVLLAVLVGVPGILAWIGSLRPVPRLVIADSSGLTTLSGKHKTTLPWARVGDIVARERRGRIVDYFVRSHGETLDEVSRVIFWSALPTAIRLIELPDQMVAVTPDELAALAAQRSGKEVRVL